MKNSYTIEYAEYVPCETKHESLNFLNIPKTTSKSSTVELKCPYCVFHSENILHHKGYGMVYIYRDKLILVDPEGIVEQKISYCPMCGRKL